MNLGSTLLLIAVLILGVSVGAGPTMLEKLDALNDCEANLPRNQHCKVVITAVPVKEGL